MTMKDVPRAGGYGVTMSRHEGALDVPGGLLDVLPAAVCVCDAAGLIVRFNRKAAELWGRTPRLGDRGDRFCGSWRLHRPDGAPLPHEACPMADVLHTGQAVRDREVVIERSDGSRIVASVNISPLRNATGATAGAVNCFLDITERKVAETALRESEARLQLLAQDADHRARNLLATVQAIVRMARADSVPGFVEVLTGRLDALSRTHALLAENRWTGADFRRLVEEELAAYRTGDGGRVTISGPALRLRADAAQVLAMATHELATNAAKYGALSAPAGRVLVQWSWDSGEQFVLRWTETDGPPIRMPACRGFGSRLIEEAVNGQLDGAVRLDWPVEGLVCQITIPRRNLLDGAGGSGS